MKEKKSEIVLGIFIIILGIVAYFYYNPYVITSKLWSLKYALRGWWTFILIIPCIISINKRGGNKINVSGLILGVLMLILSRYWYKLYVIKRYVIPVVLVLFGLAIVVCSKKGY